MATITPRKTKKGIRYTAQIRINRKGLRPYSESFSADKRSIVKEWAIQREAELMKPGGLAAATAERPSVGNVLTYYLEDYQDLMAFGRSKLADLKKLINHDISDKDATTLTTAEVLQHVRDRRASGAGPATVKNDLIWLSTAFQSVSAARNLTLKLTSIKEAQVIAKKERLIAASKKRDRRPELLELDQLLESFSSRDKRATIPMVPITLFALFSTRRQDEICRIQWSDLDRANSRVLVRDMKHPREKTDTWCALPARAMAIIDQMPQIDERIFPYNSKSVGSAFTRTCKILGIEDLHFHDLRHEAITHQFEIGQQIPVVAKISGHKSWASLQRYTHLLQLEHFDKYQGWSWLTLELSE
ncbi:site-specific recombinase, phage integrase family [gamma proteobacterium HTCC5015]|nr:site-specific recombinase, phage integrase family [gamma proteobacterium HTCC5015]